MPGDQSTLHPGSHAAREIADLWWVMFVGSAIVFAVVLVLIAAALLRGRAKRGPDPGQPRWARGLVLVAGGVIPLVVLVALFALVLSAIPATSAPRGRTRLTVAVIGHQFWWEVRYPGNRVETANEIHIPARTRVSLRVASADVIHSFWLPRLNRKIDMIPGYTNSILLEADEPGTYRGQCAEFCGLQHANMAFVVVADEPAAFRRWLRGQQKPAARTSGRGPKVFLDHGCGGCHTISGTPADGQLGPNLTHLASRSTLGANTIPNARGWLAGWILDSQHLKPGNKMPGIDVAGPDLQALLDYLSALK